MRPELRSALHQVRSAVLGGAECGSGRYRVRVWEVRSAGLGGTAGSWRGWKAGWISEVCDSCVYSSHLTLHTTTIYLKAAEDAGLPVASAAAAAAVGDWASTREATPNPRGRQLPKAGGIRDVEAARLQSTINMHFLPREAPLGLIHVSLVTPVKACWNGFQTVFFSHRITLPSPPL